MNKFITRRLEEISFLNLWQTLPYDKHFVPQYCYVFDKHGDKKVKHVLKFENLQVEFESLMKSYGLPS